jgi:hypothetical protein
MKMENDLDTILRNFYASIQPVIARYRLMEGANVHEHFNKRINDERARVLEKLRGLDAGVDVAEAKAAVNALADGEIARCKDVIEYDNLPASFRGVERGLNNAVNRIDGRK